MEGGCVYRKDPAVDGRWKVLPGEQQEEEENKNKNKKNPVFLTLGLCLSPALKLLFCTHPQPCPHPIPLSLPRPLPQTLSLLVDQSSHQSHSFCLLGYCPTQALKPPSFLKAHHNLHPLS